MKTFFRCLATLLLATSIWAGCPPDYYEVFLNSTQGFYYGVDPVSSQPQNITGTVKLQTLPLVGSHVLAAETSEGGFQVAPLTRSECVSVGDVVSVSVSMSGTEFDYWTYGGEVRVTDTCITLQPLQGGQPEGTAGQTHYLSIHPDDPVRHFLVVATSAGPMLFREQTFIDHTPGVSLLSDGQDCATEHFEVVAYLGDGTAGTGWKFVGDNLGCSLRESGGMAIITPGSQSGTIRVRCKDSNNCVRAGNYYVKSAAAPCDSCEEFAALSPEVNSVRVKVHLGKDRYHRDSGFLYLEESKSPDQKVAGESPSDPRIGTEGALKHRFTQRRALKSLVEDLEAAALLPNYQVAYTEDGAVRQVRVASGMVDLVEVGNATLQINCYRNDQFVELSQPVFEDGLLKWAALPGAVPFNRIELHNPDQGAHDYHRLWVTETRAGGSTKTYAYGFTNGVWALNNGDLTEFKVSRATGTFLLGNYTVAKESHRIVNGQDVLTHYDGKTYSLLPEIGWRKTSEQVGLGVPDQRTTSFDYHETTDPDPGRRGRLRAVIWPDGRWEYYSQYDEQGRILKKLMPLGDTVYSSMTPPIEANCRSEEYDYTTQDYVVPARDLGATSNNEWGAPRKITRRVRNYVVSTEYWLIYGAPGPLGADNLTIVERRQSGKLSPSVTESELVTTWYFRTPSVVEGEGAASLVKPVLGAVAYPDGTTRYYEYTHYLKPAGGGGYVAFPNVPYEGTPGASPGGVTWDWSSAVLRTVVTEGALGSSGQWLSTGHRTTETFTDAMGNEMGMTVVEQPGSVVTYSANYDFGTGPTADPLRRSYTVITLDQKSETVTRNDCCGARTVRDKEGVVTKFTKDFWGREASATRYLTPDSSSGASVVESQTRDINGNVLAEQRTGTGGEVLVLNQFGYNTAGEMVKHTNALLGVTTYSESLGGGPRVSTVTAPDQGVSTFTYFTDGRLKSVTGNAVAGVAYERDIEYVTDYAGTGYREYVKQTRLNAAGQPTSEWTKIFFDGAGRAYRTVYPARPGIDIAGSPERQRHFNSRGHLWKEIEPDGITTLYGYNAKGELECVAQAADARAGYTGNETSTDATFGKYPYILPAQDRITRTIREVGTRVEGVVPNQTTYPVTRTITSVLTGPTTWARVAMRETTTDGLKSWDTAYKAEAPAGSEPIVTRSETSYPQSGNWGRGTTVTQPDGSWAASFHAVGQLSWSKSYTSASILVGQTDYSYAADPYRRLATITDKRNGTTTFAYNAADLPTGQTAPPAGDGSTPQVTLSGYDNMGRLTGVTYPDQSVVNYRYWKNGRLRHNWGSQTYPVGYLYDAQGRMTTMATWRTFPGSANFLTDPNPNLTGAALTTWAYNPQRGWLEQKTAADSTFTKYGYSAAGRLTGRDWARNKAGGTTKATTTYKYDFQYAAGDALQAAFGDLRQVLYDDSQSGTDTPAVTFSTYDKRGRATLISQATTPASTTTLVYNNLGQVTSETLGGGLLNTWATLRDYDAHGRRLKLTVKQGATTRSTVDYGYDTASRLKRVLFHGEAAADYGYVTDSPMVGTVTMGTATTLGGTLTAKLTTTKAFDYLNRLRTITSVPSVAGQPTLAYGYTYNDLNQRVQQQLPDASVWGYAYDGLGQLETAKRRWADQSPVAGQQFEYAYDTIGNRTTVKAGGDDTGANLRTSTYTLEASASPNLNVNQYATRTVPHYFEVQGVAQATAAVTVTGTGANPTTPSVTRQGEYYRAELNYTANTAAISASATVNVTGGTAKAGNLFLPPATETITYDDDGNQTADGRWTYTWDAENRLVKLQSTAGPAITINFTYDWRGRLLQRQEVAASTTTTRYVYDGLQCVAELDGANAVQRTYAWGLDLSGRRTGAGGVGGLLMVKSVPQGNAVYFYGYDGNGNVATLAKSDGTVAARYEYDAYGQILRLSSVAGPTGQIPGIGYENPFRFSTKRMDSTSDLVHYELRVYSAATGRWLSRDPIQEYGGPNLAMFVNDNPVRYIDVYGFRGVDGYTARGVGHHVIPVSLWGKINFDKAAAEYLDAQVMHAKDHDFTAHSRYNDEVLAEWERFLESPSGKQFDKCCGKQGKDAAKGFTRFLATESDNKYILGFNRRVRYGPEIIDRWARGKGALIPMRKAARLAPAKKICKKALEKIERGIPVLNYALGIKSGVDGAIDVYNKGGSDSDAVARAIYENTGMPVIEGLHDLTETAKEVLSTYIDEFRNQREQVLYPDDPVIKF